MNEMIAVVKDKEEVGLSIVKKEIPTKIDSHEVILKILYASICGTDYHIYKWDQWSQSRLKLPLTIGHELVGRVIKVGSDVTDVSIGDVVSCETHIICNECELCKQGNGHVCLHTQIIGVDTDGAFAEYLKIPSQNCYKFDIDNIKVLSSLEPLGNAMHTMHHFDLNNKSVAVVGCGPIGLFAIPLAKLLGAKEVIAVEVNEYRCNLAKELGADLVVNPMKDDVIKTIRDFTDGVGVDVIGEFSGNKYAIEDAFKYIKFGGAMSMLGIPSTPLEVDIANDVVFKSLSLHGVVGRKIPDTWHQVQEILNDDFVKVLEQVITHEFDLVDIEQGMKLMGSGNCGKVILKVGE